MRRFISFGLPAVASVQARQRLKNEWCAARGVVGVLRRPDLLEGGLERVQIVVAHSADISLHLYPSAKVYRFTIGPADVRKGRRRKAGVQWRDFPRLRVNFVDVLRVHEVAGHG